ncbi:MAG: hypothetical protein JST62_01100 [Bacteroidetes bacterium]|nr:hypothetical protein [Bacteroidota bacterium]
MKLFVTSLLLFFFFSTSAQLFCPPGFSAFLPEDGSRRNAYYHKGDIEIVLYGEVWRDDNNNKSEGIRELLKEKNQHSYSVLTKDSLFISSGFNKNTKNYYYKVSDGLNVAAVFSPRNDDEFKELSKFVLRQKRVDLGIFDDGTF